MQWRKKNNHHRQRYHTQQDQYAFRSDTDSRHNNPATVSEAYKNNHQSKNMNTNYQQPTYTEFIQNNCSNHSSQYASPRNRTNFRHRSNRTRRYTSSASRNQTRNQNINYQHNDYRNTPQFQKQKKTTHERNNGVSGKARKETNPEFQNCPQSKAQTIRLNNLKYLQDFQYFVREKSDGMKALCYITQNSVYFIDEKFDIRMVTDVFYGSHGFVSMNKVILLDGEILISQKTDKHKQKCLFFRITDCVAFDGESVATQPASQREKYIDKFINNYNSKLIEYAKLRNKLKKQLNDETKSESEDCLHDHEFEDKPDISKISTQIDNNYQHTKCIKQKIINLCNGENNESNKSSVIIFDAPKLSDCDEMNKITGNISSVENIFDSIQLDIVSILFTKNCMVRATKNNLFELTKHINYNNNLNSEDGYFFTDPKTGVMTKNDGIIFIPENNRYFIKNDDDKKSDNVSMVWKPKDLLTINVAVIKEISGNENKDLLTSFINFDKLNLYVHDETGNNNVWFNAIDMGENDNIKSSKPPFWNNWHLKQRSKLNEIISDFQKNKQEKNMTHLIVQCNYNFNQQSWSLFKLSDDSKPNSFKLAQDVITRMEECIEIHDIANTLP